MDGLSVRGMTSNIPAARGFGEEWCNFPAVGAEHCARIIGGVLAPLLLTRPVGFTIDGIRPTNPQH